ncbi:MAG: hypothetical protein Q7J06_01195, partial [Bacteroidales bacterium]|nr:hypothetical protein [Bacteroidales bacterium]
SSQAEVIEKSTTYARAVSGEQDVKKTLIEFKMYSVDEVANEVVNKLKAIDMDLETKYSEEFSLDKAKKIVEESLKRIGEKGNVVSEFNLQKTLQSFGVVYRRKTKSLRLKIEAQELIKINTGEIRKDSFGVGSLRRDCTMFWNDYSMTSGDEVDRKFLKELVDMKEDGELIDMVKIENRYNFKTPLNVALSTYKPERKFIQGLVKKENAQAIDAWIKSLDVGFYSIEYSWRKGEHPKQGSFNPDFFIKTGSDIIVVEIKVDNDVSDENRSKCRYAKEHFARVNELQKEQRYYFKFLSPGSYDLFFKALREKTYGDFRSELEAKIEE